MLSLTGVCKMNDKHFYCGSCFTAGEGQPFIFRGGARTIEMEYSNIQSDGRQYRATEMEKIINRILLRKDMSDLSWMAHSFSVCSINE